MIPLPAAILLGATLGAIGRRVAGGVLDDFFGYNLKHIIATLQFGVLVGLSAYIGTGSLPFGLVSGFGCWLGHILGLHGSAGMGWITLKVTAKPPASVANSWRAVFRPLPDGRVAVWTPGLYSRDFVGMYLYGFLCLVLGGLFIELCPLGRGMRLWVLCLGALAVPVVYTVAWLIQDHRPGRRGVNGNPLELAEWMAGAAIGMSVAAV